MEFTLSTPALLFSAITLLLLAYTTRFLAVANLVRQFVTLYEKEHSKNIYDQIQSFYFRLNLIKYTQVFGTLSFLSCVVCMFFLLWNAIVFAKLIFALSLILMMASLFFALYEVFISVDALKLELDNVKK